MTENELVAKVAAEVYGVDPEDVVVTPLGLKCAIHALQMSVKDNSGIIARDAGNRKSLRIGKDCLWSILDIIDDRLLEAGWFLEGEPLPDDAVEVPLNGGCTHVKPEDVEAVRDGVPGWEWGAWALVRVLGCDPKVVEAMTAQRIQQEADYFRDEIDAGLHGER